MIQRKFMAVAFSALMLTAGMAGAEDRAKSPKGSSSTQIGESWIDVTYSRPILRGRQGIFGSGEDYGKTVKGGGDYWRVGADATTKLKTEIDLEVGGRKVPAGEYAVIADVKADGWTLILSSQKSMDKWMGREEVAKGVLWGAYGYKPEFDVARAGMELGKLDYSVDQMTINFVDVDESGATLAIYWDDVVATTRLKVAK